MRASLDNLLIRLLVEGNHYLATLLKEIDMVKKKIVLMTSCVVFPLLVFNTEWIAASSDSGIPQGDSLDALAISRPISKVLVIESASVWEWNSDKGRVRTHFNGLTLTNDLVKLNNFHTLLAKGRLINEYNAFGNLCWQKKMSERVTACQRLSNKNTFVVTNYHLYEITPEGKIMYSLHSDSLLTDAVKLPNGIIIYHPQGGKLIELDNKRRFVRKIGDKSLCSTIHVLSDGGLLVSQMDLNRVIEIDLSGKLHWIYKVDSPTSAVRLKNSNTLIASKSVRRVFEVSREGKVVSATETGPCTWITLRLLSTGGKWIGPVGK